MNVSFPTLLILWLTLSLIFWAIPFFTPPLARSSGVVGRPVRPLLGDSCGRLDRHSQTPALTAWTGGTINSVQQPSISSLQLAPQSLAPRFLP
jgi:hypothetical protein